MKNKEERHEFVDDALPEDSQTTECYENENECSKEDALLEQLAIERDKLLRLAAEYDNYRKRSQKEREALFTEARADTIIHMLPVYDNIERALKQGCSDEAYYKGIEMIMTQLEDVLSKLGVKPIDALGEVFDPAIHNAVMHVEDENAEQGVIVEEFQKGFKLGEKVIRFSMVKVAN